MLDCGLSNPRLYVVLEFSTIRAIGGAPEFTGFVLKEFPEALGDDRLLLAEGLLLPEGIIKLDDEANPFSCAALLEIIVRPALAKRPEMAFFSCGVLFLMEFVV